MAIRKVSTSNIFNTVHRDASAGNVKIADVPDTPTIGTVTVSGATVFVPFTAAATGGTATSYSTLSNPGSISATGGSSPITVTGLTEGTSYTFTITAVNSTGTSSASSVSNSVTPISEVTGSYDALASATLSTNTDYILFSGIPTGYKHLELRLTMRSTRAEASDSLNLIYNENTSSYPRHYLMGSGSSTSSYAETSSAGNVGGYITEVSTAANTTSNIFGVGIVTILDYSSSNKYKTLRSVSTTEQNGSGSVVLNSHIWQSTDPINSIRIQSGGLGDWVANSTASLYGIR